MRPTRSTGRSPRSGCCATERRRLARIRAGTEGWNIRIGLNTGPLVAGVVGTEKFAYDVWGDTVNTASRMESAGIAGQINLSQATVRLVEQFFVCEPRGRVHAKGKGQLEMFILRGLRPEFSDDGIAPNSKFESLYRALAGTDESGPVLPA